MSRNSRVATACDDRPSARAEISADLEAALAAKPAAEWEALLNATGVPAGQALDIGQIMAHPQVAYRRTVHGIEPVVEGSPPLRVLASGFRLDAGLAVPASPPPAW